MDDASLVGTVLNLTGLGVLHCLGDVGGHGAHLGVRHQATRAQYLTQLADYTHRVGSGDHNIKIHLAGLYVGREILEADDVGAGGTGYLDIGALAEHGHANDLADAARHHHGATHHLVGFTRVHTQVDGSIDGFVELGGSGFFYQAQRFVDGIVLGAFYLGFQCLDSF